MIDKRQPYITTYDGISNATYVQVTLEPIDRTLDIGHGVILDLDKNDAVVGVEILHGKKTSTMKDIK